MILDFAVWYSLSPQRDIFDSLHCVSVLVIEVKWSLNDIQHSATLVFRWLSMRWLMIGVSTKSHTGRAGRPWLLDCWPCVSYSWNRHNQTICWRTGQNRQKICRKWILFKSSALNRMHSVFPRIDGHLWWIVWLLHKALIVGGGGMAGVVLDGQQHISVKHFAKWMFRFVTN